MNFLKISCKKNRKNPEFEGKILKSGSAEELADDEQVRTVYLGQNFVLKKRKMLTP